MALIAVLGHITWPESQFTCLNQVAHGREPLVDGGADRAVDQDA